MKKFLIVCVSACLFFSCSNHGKKIAIEGTRGEVYYKEGATEAEAQKLGAYLKSEKYFSNEAATTVQLRKAKGEGYDVHFVVDEEKVKATPGIEDQFIIIGDAISKTVFNGKPVNIFLSDQKLKDFKSLPYNKQKAEELISRPQ